LTLTPAALAVGAVVDDAGRGLDPSLIAAGRVVLVDRGGLDCAFFDRL